MNFRFSVKYFLVHHLRISNREADENISQGKVKINQFVIFDNCKISPQDEIHLNGKLIQKAIPLFYYKYYKPVGIESTLHPEIKNNLLQATGLNPDIFPVGRLDKESEGLMLLTSDGVLYRKLIWPHQKKEKEYEVVVNELLMEEQLLKMENGMCLRNYQTAPCKTERILDRKFKIILTEGKNRQIRNMCASLGLNVLQLKRTRIDSIYLEQLIPGEIRELSIQEIKALKEENIKIE